ncbi:hypothetical protein [Pseudomonas brassicacearum]|uniref:hypothetical protein n=1 Tax=Pseudomonas brassicacearum TaxID=930166 RepID=UPI0009B95D3C|nr:hypothetical protein [Pseudomonas brassicacearum]
MNWILTYTGKRFDLFEPDVDLIDPRDIRTLDAGNSTLPQPDERYKKTVISRLTQSETVSTIAQVLQYLTEFRFIHAQLIQIKFQIFSIGISKCSLVEHRVLKNPTGVTYPFEGLQCRSERLLAHGLGNSKHQSLMDTFKTPCTHRRIVTVFSVPVGCGQRRVSFLNYPLCQEHRPYLNAELGLFSSPLFERMCLSRNQKGSNDSADGTYCLHPSSRAFTRLCKQEDESAADNKSPRRRKRNLEQRIGFEAYFLWEHSWLQAITKSAILTNSHRLVHGVMA